VAQLDTIEAAIDALSTSIAQSGGTPTEARALCCLRSFLPGCDNTAKASHSSRPCTHCVHFTRPCAHAAFAPSEVEDLRLHDSELTGVAVQLDNIKSRERAIRLERYGGLPILCMLCTVRGVRNWSVRMFDGL